MPRITRPLPASKLAKIRARQEASEAGPAFEPEAGPTASQEPLFQHMFGRLQDFAEVGDPKHVIYTQLSRHAGGQLLDYLELLLTHENLMHRSRWLPAALHVSRELIQSYPIPKLYQIRYSQDVEQAIDLLSSLYGPGNHPCERWFSNNGVIHTGFSIMSLDEKLNVLQEICETCYEDIPDSVATLFDWLDDQNLKSHPNYDKVSYYVWIAVDNGTMSERVASSEWLRLLEDIRTSLEGA